MNKQLKLLCDTNQMAYGSSSALLAILKYLPSINTAFVWGVTEEILLSSKLIQTSVKINNKDNEQIKANIDLIKFDAVLVISNLININWYLDFGIPVFFVDLHSWYPSPKNHRVWKEGKKCFIERFFVETKNKIQNSINVGPIITIQDKKTQTEKQILVNIGGGENRWIKPGKNSNYINIILEILSEITNKFIGYKIIIAAGKKSIELIKNNPISRNFVIGTFSQDDYLELLNKSEILITSPGLNAVFEGFYYNKKIIFLPPQNASQIIQLKYYEKTKLIKKGLNLTEYYKEFKSLKSTILDEQDLTNEVLKTLKQLEFDKQVKRKMILHITEQIKDISNNSHIQTYKEVKNILGLPGAETIAKQIVASLSL